MFGQVMPDMLILKLKRKHFFDERVVHEHYSDERQDKTSSHRIKQHTCLADDSVRVEQLELMEKQGFGKIERKPGKTIWHRIDKQDGNFKFHKHDVKF